MREDERLQIRIKSLYFEFLRAYVRKDKAQKTSLDLIQGSLFWCRVSEFIRTQGKRRSRSGSIGDLAFDGCSGLTAINFQGIMAQWQAIEKGMSWDNLTGEYAVICTDGTISKADA